MCVLPAQAHKVQRERISRAHAPNRQGFRCLPQSARDAVDTPAHKVNNLHEQVGGLRMTQPLKIDYVEFYSAKLEATQEFFAKACGWDFVACGPDDRDIQGAGVGGGIERGAHKAPLIVLRAGDLQAAYDQLCRAEAEITKEVFAFPGGRRFEFREPGGSKMAVWSDT